MVKNIYVGRAPPPKKAVYHKHELKQLGTECNTTFKVASVIFLCFDGPWLCQDTKI